MYSGTVAAATEGRFLGLPSIAISLASSKCTYYETAAQITKKLIEHLQNHPLPDETILNVNVPDMPLDSIHGLQITRLGKRQGAKPMVHEIDPRGRHIYWVGQSGPQHDASPGTDFYAVNTGYVSITPLHFDLTHYHCLDALSAWAESLQIL